MTAVSSLGYQLYNGLSNTLSGLGQTASLPMTQPPTYNTSYETPVDQTPSYNTSYETPVDQTPAYTPSYETPVDQTTNYSTVDETPVTQPTTYSTVDETPVTQPTTYSTVDETPVTQPSTYSTVDETPVTQPTTHSIWGEPTVTKTPDCPPVIAPSQTHRQQIYQSLSNGAGQAFREVHTLLKKNAPAALAFGGAMMGSCAVCAFMGGAMAATGGIMMGNYMMQQQTSYSS
jgi:hypothetical protein